MTETQQSDDQRQAELAAIKIELSDLKHLRGIPAERRSPGSPDDATIRQMVYDLAVRQTLLERPEGPELPATEPGRVWVIPAPPDVNTFIVRRWFMLDGVGVERDEIIIPLTRFWASYFPRDQHGYPPRGRPPLPALAIGVIEHLSRDVLAWLSICIDCGRLRRHSRRTLWGTAALSCRQATGVSSGRLWRTPAIHLGLQENWRRSSDCGRRTYPGKRSPNNTT